LVNGRRNKNGKERPPKRMKWRGRDSKLFRDKRNDRMKRDGNKLQGKRRLSARYALRR
jgi:hypothetical protein